MSSAHRLLVNNRSVFTSKLVEALICPFVLSCFRREVAENCALLAVCFIVVKVFVLTLFTCNVTPLDTKFQKKFHE